MGARAVANFEKKEEAKLKFSGEIEKGKAEGNMKRSCYDHLRPLINKVNNLY